MANEITELLAAWTGRDPTARERLLPLVYDELHRLAAGYLRRERVSHTLQPTALIHEMYLRIGGIDRMQWQDRAHFMAMAATLMRRVLVDHARERARAKRGGAITLASLAGHDVAGPEPAIDVLALDEALEQLAALDPQQSRVVELRFFGGLTIEETAASLGISPATVKREWALAKAWLFRQLSAS